MAVVVLDSSIRCPACGHRKEETMPTEACVWFYECEHCKTVLRPKSGDCCVYCSYGTNRCAFDSKSKLCVGCFRTLDEIRGWKKMTDYRRHQVINDRARRQAKLYRESPALSAAQPRTPDT